MMWHAQSQSWATKLNAFSHRIESASTHANCQRCQPSFCRPSYVRRRSGSYFDKYLLQSVVEFHLKLHLCKEIKNEALFFRFPLWKWLAGSSLFLQLIYF